MKIKLLFFPAVLAISIIIFIFYVWPELGAVRKAKSDLDESKKVLENILEKKNNLENLKNGLNQNQDKESLVLSYLPPDKNEERIINGINYLAANSGASLADLSLEKEKSVTNEEYENTADSKEILFSGSSADSADFSAGQALKPRLRFVKFKISINGNYDNIKTFLEDLHKMEMFNSVDSVLISKQEKNKDQAQNQEALQSVIEAGFGYLPKAKINGNYSASIFTQLSFDFTPCGKLKALVSKKIPDLEIGERGRVNPFLP